MIPSEMVTVGAIRQSVGAGLNALAAECHRLAVARGEYDGWTPTAGVEQIEGEGHEWWNEALMQPWPRAVASESERAAVGQLLATVLSIAHHRGIDVEAALRDAMQRNRERAGRGE